MKAQTAHLTRVTASTHMTHLTRVAVARTMSGCGDRRDDPRLPASLPCHNLRIAASKITPAVLTTSSHRRFGSESRMVGTIGQGAPCSEAAALSQLRPGNSVVVLAAQSGGHAGCRDPRDGHHAR